MPARKSTMLFIRPHSNFFAVIFFLKNGCVMVEALCCAGSHTDAERLAGEDRGGTERGAMPLISSSVFLSSPP